MRSHARPRRAYQQVGCGDYHYGRPSSVNGEPGLATSSEVTTPDNSSSSHTDVLVSYLEAPISTARGICVLRTGEGAFIPASDLRPEATVASADGPIRGISSRRTWVASFILGPESSNLRPQIVSLGVVAFGVTDGVGGHFACSHEIGRPGRDGPEHLARRRLHASPVHSVHAEMPR